MPVSKCATAVESHELLRRRPSAPFGASAPYLLRAAVRPDPWRCSGPRSLPGLYSMERRGIGAGAWIKTLFCAAVEDGATVVPSGGRIETVCYLPLSRNAETAEAMARAIRRLYARPRRRVSSLLFLIMPHSKRTAGHLASLSTAS